MYCGVYTFALILVAFRSCRSQSSTFNLTKFNQTADKDNNGILTKTEVDSLFEASLGALTDRCPYLDWMVGMFDGESTRVSVMFDLMQSINSTVSSDDFTSFILGGSAITNLSYSGLVTNIQMKDAYIDKILIKPADYTSGPTFWQYNQFQIQQWADNADKDKNNIITRLELSAAMRSLDQNGDWGIKKCEFINSMILYTQHSVASSKVYNEIFHFQDLTWADVDSDLLMRSMDDDNDGGNVTKQMFIDYFSKENQMAAGIVLFDDNDDTGDGASPQFTAAVISSLMSAIIALVFSFIVY